LDERVQLWWGRWSKSRVGGDRETSEKGKRLSRRRTRGEKKKEGPVAQTRGRKKRDGLLRMGPAVQIKVGETWRAPLVEGTTVPSNGSGEMGLTLA